MQVWFWSTAAVFVSLVVHRKLATRCWTILIAGTIAAMLVLSGTLVAALIAMWVSLVAVLIGDAILALLKVPPPQPADRLVITFSLGLVALALLTLGFAYMGLLKPALVAGALIVLTVLQTKRALHLGREMKPAWSRWSDLSPDLEFRALLILFGLVLAANMMWVVAPEIHFDALNYHLAVPRIYLEESGLVELPYFFHSYFAHLLEMLFALCMALGGEMAAKLLIAIIGLVAAVSVYCLGRTVFAPRIGLWAAVFFYTNPLTSWLTGTTHTDLTLSLVVTAACVAFLQWNHLPQSRWIVAAGLLTGGAVALKLNGAYAAIGLGVALLIVLARSTERVSRKVRTIAMFVVPALLVAAPWYAIVYWHTGNPVFPLLNGIFRSPKGDLTNTLMNAADFGVGTSVQALIRLPFRLTFDTGRFGEALPRGALGPLLAVFF